ncbi:hypothetical protein EGW08_000233 [Elysia chlorotica]|uniref:COMM domain-containing protein 5 n=1 Tax=Elysia chlorotica TaxID=188477 RepID=A0A433UDI9_ELYCH|nr:hypothetical protein EGW08_000233 [Elysia chlorotica]
MSIIQVKGGGGGGAVGLERTSFVGARVPPEIRAMIKPLSKLDQTAFKKILKGKLINSLIANFIQDLQDLQIPEGFHEDLVAMVVGPKRPVIDSFLENRRPRLPSLENLSWRTDVAISTGVLNRVLVRGVTMEMTLSDGSIKDFEMTVSKFQELRFHVASVLGEMEKLEKHSILKIKD